MVDGRRYRYVLHGSSFSGMGSIFLCKKTSVQGNGYEYKYCGTGSWDKGIVASLSDVVLVEECCVYRCQGFCQLLRVSAISVLCVLGGGTPYKVTVV